MSTPKPPQRSLLSLRSTVIFAIAILAGIIVGTLTCLTGASLAAGVLAGLTTTAGIIPVLDKFVGS